MRVLRKVLIGFGSIFILLIALFVWLGVQSASFKHKENPFVEAYVTDLSRRWDVADVYDRSANEFVAQADSIEGRQAIQRFKPLGALTSIHDFELKNYSDGTWGHRGVFDFKAAFQNGDALVEIIVVQKGDVGARVLAINLSSIRMNRASVAGTSI